MDEVERLRRCLNDLVAVMALPALWTGGGSQNIAGPLMDALMGMLRPAFVFVRLNQADGGPFTEMARLAAPWEGVDSAKAIGHVLDGSLGALPRGWPSHARLAIQGAEFVVAAARLGIDGEIGILVVGSRRADFPQQTERLILDVAANQAAIGLQQERKLAEQQRVSRELDERVTQRTRDLAAANERLKKSENESRLIVDSIPGLVALLSPAGDLELVNRQLLEYFGQTLEELRAWGTNDTIHPEDRRHVLDVFSRSIGAGTPYEIVQRFKRSDGVYRWFQNRGFPLRDTGGKVARWCVLLTDIENQKQAEELLRRQEAFLAKGQLLSLSGSFSWWVDTNEVTFSEGARRIFRFEPETPVTIERIAGCVHPDDRAILAERIGGARGPGGEQNYNLRLQLADGSIKYLRASSQETRDASGRREYVGAVQDVTEGHLAEQALDKARSDLAHVARVTSLSALTASITHEINQPLSGIITNAGTCLRMLNADPPNVDGARETVRRTIRDGNRASDVITRLRALFSRKEFALELLDLNEATREVIALSWNDLQRNQVIVQTELAEGLPAVTGDRIQLQQVILNLLRNASDAMAEIHDRPRRLSIRTECTDNQYVRLSAQDSGVGFESQSIEKLFDSFYTTKSGGMGIGLSVSRSIIERHRGRLWAEANEGPGATFSFTVPCGAETDPASAESQS